MEFRIDQTSHKMFLRCPRQWEFRYVKGLKFPPSAALFLGGTINRSAAFGYKYKIEVGEDVPLDELLDFYSRIFDKREAVAEGETERIPDIDWKDEKPGEVKDTGYRILRYYRMSLMPKREPIEVELAFEKDLGFCKFYGILDRIDIDGRVKDLKTISPFAANFGDFSERGIELDIQPTAYALGMGGAISFEFELLLKDPKNPRVIIRGTERTEDDINWYLRLLESDVKMIKAGLFPPRPNWSCFSLDTEVATLDGWKGYSKLSLNDLVLTFNRETGLLEWQRPLRIFVKEHQARKMVCYEGRSLNFCVTPDHGMLVRRLPLKRPPKYSGEFAWKRKSAAEIEHKSWCYPIAGEMDFPSLPIRDEWIQLAGWAAAEANFPSDDINIVFSQKRDSWGYYELKRLFDTAGLGHMAIPYVEYEQNDGCSRFRLNYPAASLLRAIQPGKVVPDWLFFANKRQFKLWIEAFGAGDGRRRNRSLTLTQKDERFIDKLQLLALLHGYSAVKNPQGKEGSFPGSGLSFSVNLIEGRLDAAIGTADVQRNFNRDADAKEVWCLTVPNGTVVARRAGRPLISFNCGEWCAYRQLCGFRKTWWPV